MMGFSFFYWWKVLSHRFLRCSALLSTHYLSVTGKPSAMSLESSLTVTSWATELGYRAGWDIEVTRTLTSTTCYDKSRRPPHPPSLQLDVPDGLTPTQYGGKVAVTRLVPPSAMLIVGRLTATAERHLPEGFALSTHIFRAACKELSRTSIISQIRLRVLSNVINISTE